MRAKFVGFGLALLSPVALACSFVQPNPASFDPSLAKPGETVPAVPNVVVESISRGNAGNPQDSCGDTGVVVLSIPATADTKGLIYTFDLISGEADDVIFQPSPATGFEDEGSRRLLFVFPWLDGASNEQEPLNLIVRVTPHLPSGLAGTPIEISVVDPGR